MVKIDFEYVETQSDITTPFNLTLLYVVIAYSYGRLDIIISRKQ